MIRPSLIAPLPSPPDGVSRSEEHDHLQADQQGEEEGEENGQGSGGAEGYNSMAKICFLQFVVARWYY